MQRCSLLCTKMQANYDLALSRVAQDPQAARGCKPNALSRPSRPHAEVPH